MSAAYSPTAVLSADDPALPQGDPANLDGARANRDTRKYLRFALPALLEWSRELEVLPGGSRTAFSIRVGAITVGVFNNGSGAYYPVGAAETTITQAKAAGADLGATSQPWYVYAFRAAGGAIDYEITTTAPSEGRRFKTSATTHHYLGTFFTDSTGAPIPMLAIGGRCLYRRSAIASVEGLIAADGLCAVDAAGAVARTALDLSARVPPHARIAIVQGTVAMGATSSGGVGALNLYTAADTTSVASLIQAQATSIGDQSVNSQTSEIQLTSAQIMGYSVTQTNATAQGTIDLLGWEE